MHYLYYTMFALDSNISVVFFFKPCQLTNKQGLHFYSLSVCTFVDVKEWIEWIFAMSGTDWTRKLLAFRFSILSVSALLGNSAFLLAFLFLFSFLLFILSPLSYFHQQIRSRQRKRRGCRGSRAHQQQRLYQNTLSMQCIRLVISFSLWSWYGLWIWWSRCLLVWLVH